MDKQKIRGDSDNTQIASTCAVRRLGLGLGLGFGLGLGLGLALGLQLGLELGVGSGLGLESGLLNGSHASMMHALPQINLLTRRSYPVGATYLVSFNVQPCFSQLRFQFSRHVGYLELQLGVGGIAVGIIYV